MSESPFVTTKSAVLRPFYVLVEQQLLSNDESSLDLNEGDIFLVTKYNKVGYWWGVSVYDLDRQGWFPSTFVQPYTGEVPEDASELCSQIKLNCETPPEEPEPVHAAPIPEQRAEFNIVQEDSSSFLQYESTVAISKRGRLVQAAGPDSDQAQPNEDDDFDYDTWADEKNAQKLANSTADRHKRRKP